MDTTSSLPIDGAGLHSGRHSSTTQAHRVQLYGVLDSVCRPLDAADVQAVFRLAELDGVTVQAVIDWINAARMLPRPL
ncbi:hypothetical protein ACWDSD_22660 [Streptomyces spiralis]